MNIVTLKNVTYKLFIYKLSMFDVDMYKQDLALDNLQGLICRKTQPTLTSHNTLWFLTLDKQLGDFFFLEKRATWNLTNQTSYITLKNSM